MDPRRIVAPEINTQTGVWRLQPSLPAAAHDDQPPEERPVHSAFWREDRPVFIGEEVYYLHEDQVLGSAW
ncbi:MAG: hypothetical protein R3E89_05910 [Thiolinea sp.]